MGKYSGFVGKGCISWGLLCGNWSLGVWMNLSDSWISSRNCKETPSTLPILPAQWLVYNRDGGSLLKQTTYSH